MKPVFGPGQAEVEVDGSSLTVENVIRVARFGAKARITKGAMGKMLASRLLVEKALGEGRTIYGINTGFGDMCNTRIERKDISKLQENLIMSHAVGVGEPFSDEVVRAILLLRANALVRGNSGCRPVVADTLIQMLNKGVVPVVPSQGSVGSSGDLAPLAHVVLVMIGKGEAVHQGKRLSGGTVMEKAGICPLSLEAKEGLSLINGTQAMTACACIALNDAFSAYEHSLLALSFSLEGLLGTLSSYDPRLHDARNQPGQIETARRVLEICADSEIIASHRECPKVQDAYSLRCAPQVLGASLDSLRYVESVVAREINASTDNPLVFEGPDGNAVVISGGNFHGQPVALVSDFLAIAVSEIGNIMERLCARLVDPKLSCLPANLVKDGGLNSGFMITQYVAAALVSENKVLCHPASVDSIPTSSNQEDHVSMGTIAARKAMTVTRNSMRVVSIALMLGAQSIAFHAPKKSAKTIEAAVIKIRKKIPVLEKDRELRHDMESIFRMMESGELLSN